jgi:hypothetical protein
MKGLAKRPFFFSLVICVVVAVFAGCGSPWVKSLTAPLYEDEDVPDGTAAPAASTVTGVTVNPAAANVVKGGTQQFSAVVNGTGNPEQTVTWSIDETAIVAGTDISAGGLLTVAAAETAGTLTVRATSTVDTGKSAAAAVTVTVPGMDDEDFGIGIVPDQTFNVNDAAGWAAALAGITSPGNYVINLTGTISVPDLPAYPNTTFGTVSPITVSLRGGGSLAYVDPSYTYASLFTVNAGQSLIIRDFTLQGDNDNGWALLEVFGGSAILKTGGKITGNIAGATVGGGVFVDSGGSFTMEGGEISGNTSTGGSGGGVYIGSGIFTMSGGEIKSNTSPTGQGGGVYVGASATFTKTGGTIYGGSDTPPNTSGASGYGHAVYTAAESGKYRDDTVSDNISVSGGVCGGTWY